MSEYSKNLMNQLVPSKRHLYDVLENSADYSVQLPAFSCKAVSVKYLVAVANNQVFSIQKANFKVIKRKIYVSKFDLFVELSQKVQNLGFTPDDLPDKAWMLNVLYSIDSNHQFFNFFEIPKLQISDK